MPKNKYYKKALVDASGGCCQVCGYNKCLAALSFHHVNPTQKDFELGVTSIGKRNWSKVVEEARKCVLVCNNCHTEIHHNLTETPDIIFDDRFCDHDFIEEHYLTDSCGCGNKKDVHRKTCNTCKSKINIPLTFENILKHLIDNSWNRRQTAYELHIDRRELYNQMKRLGISSM